MIQVKNLSKTFKISKRRKGLTGAIGGLFRRDYHYVHALEKISFEMEAGELVGYIGPNGAGKSTTVKILAGILVPDSGTCLVGGRGFDLFGGMVRNGAFDRILLRPRSTILQLIGFEFTLKRIGRISQGLLVLLWGTYNLQLSWTLLKILLFIGSILGSICLFLGLFIIQAAISFQTIETLEIMNTMTYGGTYAAQYPLSIYRQGLRRFFTYIVPLAGVNYFPLVTILEKQDVLGTPLWFGYLTPLSGLLFFLASLLIWRLGVRYYQSTGS